MRIVFFSVALLLSNLASGAVPIEGWYASGLGGYTFVPDNVTHTDRSGLLRTHTSFNNGWNLGGSIGYQRSPIRYEAEVIYLQSELIRLRINHFRQISAGGNTKGIFAMANVYYDFPEMVPCIAPFLGIGLGYGHVSAELKSFGPLFFAAPLIRTHIKVSDNVFAYQASAGFSYHFSENYSANLAYRFISTGHADGFNNVYQANLASVGIIFRFDGASYK